MAGASEDHEGRLPLGEPPTSSRLKFQRLDVYRAAVTFVVVCDGLQKKLPGGRGYVADQLRRAALSIVNNIAEGAGEFSPADKARFYRMALRSTTECAATIDVLSALDECDPDKAKDAAALAVRLVVMLTRLISSVNRRRQR